MDPVASVMRCATNCPNDSFLAFSRSMSRQCAAWSEGAQCVSKTHARDSAICILFAIMPLPWWSVLLKQEAHVALAAPVSSGAASA